MSEVSELRKKANEIEKSVLDLRLKQGEVQLELLKINVSISRLIQQRTTIQQQLQEELKKKPQ